MNCGCGWADPEPGDKDHRRWHTWRFGPRPAPFDRTKAHNAGPVCRTCSQSHTAPEALRLMAAAHQWPPSPWDDRTESGRPADTRRPQPTTRQEAS